MNLKDVKFEYLKGQGPGGQRKNKVLTKVRATHIPTGLKVEVDGRHRHKNQREAIKLLETKIQDQKQKQIAKRKKERRDDKIRNTKRIRTYDFKNKTVKDHRSGKTVPLEKMMGGEVDLLWLSKE